MCPCSTGRQVFAKGPFTENGEFWRQKTFANGPSIMLTCLAGLPVTAVSRT